jgi:hypothetical protein
MSDELTYSSILIELDCLFDTRLCTLASMGDDILNKAFNDNYFTRLIDRFVGIDNDLYSTSYDKRDKSILKYAYITPLSDLIKEFSVRAHKQIISSPFHSKPKIIVNTYPYILTDEEADNIIQGLITLTEGIADIELINNTYEDLTPAYIKQLDIVVMYRYDIWLETHSKNKLLTKTTCPDVELLAPGIFFKQVTDKNIKPLESFKAMEELTAPFISLKLLPIKEFCVKL